MSSQNSIKRNSFKREQIRRFFSIPTFSYDEDEEEGRSAQKTEYSPPPAEGYQYVQMSLGGENFTPEFEEKLQKRISSQVKIRKATEDEIPLLTKLYNRSFLTAQDPYSPMKEEDMRDIFHYNKTIILIAQIWGTDAGFIIIDFEISEDGKKIGYISGLGTLPEWQKRGVGTTLGIASWAYFKEAGVQELQCEVYKKNLGSYKLIKGMGFIEKGVKYYKF
ncbi:MAG: N-acetyltransferase [Promethearchaeota archaeon]|nr:MAG: N-acetyltransferase [Candidatus Lokiarchaeota archaeon]